MAQQYSWWIRGGFLALITLSMFWLCFGISHVFPSPDERANAFFSQTFAENFSFCVQEPLNDVAQGLVHPRSVVAPGTYLLPASFLGFSVLNGSLMFFGGLIADAFASFLSFAMTPLLVALAIAAWWWLLWRASGNKRFADFGAILVLIHPAWWYYGARVMMHNVPFVSLLMIGAALVFYAYQRASRSIGALAGVVIGIGFSLRLVEFPVAIILLVVAGLFWRQTLRTNTVVRRVAVWTGVGIMAILGAYLVLNHAVYGSWFTTGYTLPDTRSTGGAVVSVSLIQHIFNLLFPFGIHPRAVLRHVIEYGVQLYPIFSTLALFGLVFSWKAKKNVWRKGTILLLIAATWLGVVYGSWSISDSISAQTVTIGNSYVRYWLPLFVASSLYGAYALQRFSQRSRAMTFVVFGVLAGMFFLSVRTVFGGTDGLFATRNALVAYEDVRAQVIDRAQCSEGGDDRPVVIVDYADKYLFPDCRVIVPLRSDATYAIMPTLVDVVPLYYFGLTLPSQDLDFFNTGKLWDNGLQITPLESIENQTLYQITRVEAQETL